ncbi:MAG: VOC family protein [Alphaproteobacteria bacterium]|jgi:catechol 2,3-dioxygenase-like lactoylglutathione lyase family enzyme
MPALSKVAQIALTTQNLAAAIAFYRDTLGLKLLFEVPGMAFLDAGGIRLMLGEAKLSAPLQNNTYVYFDAGDWNETEAALEARGLKFDRPADVVQRAEGKEHAIRFFRDPDGNALAIMGWRPAKA